MFDQRAAGAISPELARSLLSGRQGYIKPIASEQVGFLCADAPLLAAGFRVFVLHDSDGTPLLVAESREAALSDAATRDMETVSVH